MCVTIFLGFCVCRRRKAVCRPSSSSFRLFVVLEKKKVERGHPAKSRKVLVISSNTVGSVVLCYFWCSNRCAFFERFPVDFVGCVAIDRRVPKGGAPVLEEVRIGGLRLLECRVVH